MCESFKFAIYTLHKSLGLESLNDVYFPPGFVMTLSPMYIPNFNQKL